ncbi:MAG: OsmC family protein [Rhodobacterales bacterium]|nr:OsmC family protein [Rhodobacterales bacterium]
MTHNPDVCAQRPAAGRRAQIKTVKAMGAWEGGMATLVSVREHRFRADEPVHLGGEDTAATPMELVAGAVNACVTVVIATVAKEFGIDVKDLRTESLADIDVRGFHGTADVSPHFCNYRLVIDLTTDAPRDQLDMLCAQTEKRCPAVNLVRDSGAPVEVVWNISSSREPVQ